MLGRVGFRPAEEAPVRDIGVARPHLLAVRRTVAAPLGARAHPGQTSRRRARRSPGAGAFAVQHLSEGSLALRLGAVLQHRRADEMTGLAGGRGAPPRRREVEEPALDDRRAAAAFGRRPRDRGPAAVGELLLPRAISIHIGSSTRVQRGRGATSRADSHRPERAPSRNARSLAERSQKGATLADRLTGYRRMANSCVTCTSSSTSSAPDPSRTKRTPASSAPIAATAARRSSARGSRADRPGAGRSS